MVVEYLLEQIGDVYALGIKFVDSIGGEALVITTIIALAGVVLPFFLRYRARSYRVFAVANLPLINFDKTKFPLNLTVVNNGERQFSIESICIWLRSRNDFGMIFNVSLTEIGASKLEDGDQLKQSIDIRKYLDDLASKKTKGSIQWPPNRLDISFKTTTGKEIPIELSADTEKKIISEISPDNNSIQ